MDSSYVRRSLTPLVPNNGSANDLTRRSTLLALSQLTRRRCVERTFIHGRLNIESKSTSFGRKWRLWLFLCSRYFVPHIIAIIAKVVRRRGSKEAVLIIMIITIIIIIVIRATTMLIKTRTGLWSKKMAHLPPFTSHPFVAVYLLPFWF